METDSLPISTKSDAKFMNLNDFFETYEVPVLNRNMIKVNGELLIRREGFLANKSRIAKVEINRDAVSQAFINIIATACKK